jgi:hypothetical protein
MSLTGPFNPSIPEYEAFLSCFKVGADSALLERGKNRWLTKTKLSNTKKRRSLLMEPVSGMAKE